MNRDIVQRYKNLPLTVRAIQFNGANVELIREFTSGKMSAFHRKNNMFYVNTIEGLKLVNIGDYVVAGILGEYSIIRETEFDLTYEVITDGNAGSAQTGNELRDGTRSTAERV